MMPKERKLLGQASYLKAANFKKKAKTRLTADGKYGLTANDKTKHSEKPTKNKDIPNSERQNLTKSSTKTAPTITARDEYYAKKYASRDILNTKQMRN